MGEPLIIFKAVNSDSEKQMLMQKLMSSQEFVTLKGKQDKTVALKVLSLNSQSHLKCHPPEENTLNFSENATFTATFTLDGEKFLFETKPTIHDNYISLPVAQLFHLQKRKNFRYSIPGNYPAVFKINSLNKVICSHSCRLLDLSTEGCAVELAHDLVQLKLNDSVQAEIILGHRDPIVVQGVIKNLRPQGNSQLTLGVEFNHLAHPSEEKIIHTLSELQREIYLRKAG